MLLFLACSLLLKGTEEIVNLLTEHDIELNDFLIYPLWDTTNWLDDTGTTGSFLASLFGYRAQPIGLSVITFVVYWLVIIALFCRRGKNMRINRTAVLVLTSLLLSAPAMRKNTVQVIRIPAVMW